MSQLFELCDDFPDYNKNIDTYIDIDDRIKQIIENEVIDDKILGKIEDRIQKLMMQKNVSQIRKDNFVLLVLQKKNRFEDELNIDPDFYQKYIDILLYRKFLINIYKNKV